MSKNDLNSAGKVFADRRVQQRGRRSALIDWILDAPSRNRPISEESLNQGALMQFDATAQSPALGQIIADDPVRAAKTFGVTIPAISPDLLGLGMQGVNALGKVGQRAVGLPEQDVFVGEFSGDPLRRAVGLDPDDPEGILLEAIAPVGTFGKTLAIAGKFLTSAGKVFLSGGFGLEKTISAATPVIAKLTRGEKALPQELSSAAITATPESGVSSVNDRMNKFLTDDERGLMTIGDRKAIEELLQTSASPAEVASMAAAGGAKRGWYEESVKAIKHVFGEEDGERFAALLAAMSPQTGVESNLRNALNTWKNWVNAGRPQDKMSILRIMGESVEGERGIDSVMGAWVPNTIRALTKKNPIDEAVPLLSGPKVYSFMKNLTGIFREVTQDTWMARALGMSQQRDFSGRKLIAVVGEDGQKLGAKKSGYLAGNMLVREAADIMTQRTGRTWTPAEVQETVWSWTKAIWESQGTAGETRRIPEILRAGGVSDDIIRDTPDFATMFRDNPEFRGILEEAGLGKQVDTIPGSSFGRGRAVSLDSAGERNLESASRRLDRTGRSRGEGTAEDIFQFSRRLIRPGEDTGAAPGIYRATNRRSGTGALADTPVTQYTLPKEKQAELRKLGVSSTPPINQFDDPQRFHDLVVGAKDNAGSTTGFLDLKTVDEYAGMQTFVTSDGSAGFAIAADGDIVSVFNNRAGKLKGVSPHLLSLAIERGGKKLDAFDGVLTDIYGDMGFVEVERFKFDPRQAPDDWDVAAFGRPDIVFMELQ